MAIYLVAVNDGVVIATAANYSLSGFLALAETLALKIQDTVIVVGVRLNTFHEPLGIGEKFDVMNPGARIIDQTFAAYGKA